MRNIKIGFTASSFDLLHAGHILMLEECKENCDYLIVGFNVNPVGKETVQNVYERFVQLKAVKFVDEIIPYGSEEDLLNILRTIRIDVRFVGEDYIGRKFTGSDMFIPIYYNARKHNYSTTALKNKLKEKQNE